MTIEELKKANKELEQQSRECAETINRNNEQIVKNIGVIEYLEKESNTKQTK